MGPAPITTEKSVSEYYHSKNFLSVYQEYDGFFDYVSLFNVSYINRDRCEIK